MLTCDGGREVKLSWAHSAGWELAVLRGSAETWVAGLRASDVGGGEADATTADIGEGAEVADGAALALALATVAAVTAAWGEAVTCIGGSSRGRDGTPHQSRVKTPTASTAQLKRVTLGDEDGRSTD